MDNNINLVYRRDVDIIPKTGWRKRIPFFNGPDVKYGDFQLSQIIINANSQGVSEIYQTPKVYNHNHHSGDYSTEIRTGSSFSTLGPLIEQPNYIDTFKEGWSAGVETVLQMTPFYKQGKLP